MDRRKFLGNSALLTTCMAGSASLLASSCTRDESPVSNDPAAIAARNSTPELAVAEGKDWAGLVRAVVDSLGGIGAFVKKGNTVVVKPNIGWDRNPEQAANTHPEVLKAVVDLCLEAEAGKVKIFDRTCDEMRRSYTNSGIGQAMESIKDKRVKFSHIDKRKFINVEINGGHKLKSWTFYKEALDADVYINVPIAKHHSLSTITAGLKNIMGVIGKTRSRIHWSFEKSIVDLNTVIRPQLTITDATRILLRNGPQGGKLEDVDIKNTVIASADIVAADAYVAKTLFNLEPGNIGHIKKAYDRGLGQLDLAKIKVINA